MYLEINLFKTKRLTAKVSGMLRYKTGNFFVYDPILISRFALG